MHEMLKSKWFWWAIGILLVIVTNWAGFDDEKVESGLIGLVMSVMTIGMFSGVFMRRFSLFVRALYFMGGLLFLWATCYGWLIGFPGPSPGEEIAHHVIHF